MPNPCGDGLTWDASLTQCVGLPVAGTTDVIDNADTGFSGNFTQQQSSTAAVNGSYAWDWSTSARSAAWSFAVPGIYDAYVTWPVIQGSCLGNVTYRAAFKPYETGSNGSRVIAGDGEGPKAVTVSQCSNPSSVVMDGKNWLYLGRVWTDEGMGGDGGIIQVMFQSNATSLTTAAKKVAADAARLVKISDVPPVAPEGVTLVDDGDVGFTHPVLLDADRQITNRTSDSSTVNGSYFSLHDAGFDCTYYDQHPERIPGWRFRAEPYHLYRVYATYPVLATQNTGETTRYTINGDPALISSVNQHIAPDGATFEGRPWKSLGTFVSQTDTLFVSVCAVCNGSDSYVCHAGSADAVRIEDVTDHTPPDGSVIIDDTDEGFESGLCWNVASGSPSPTQNVFGSTYREAKLSSCTSTNKSAKWTATLEPGRYNVYVSYDPSSNRIKKANYSISGPVATVNQTVTPQGTSVQGVDFQLIQSDMQVGTRSSVTVSLYNIENGTWAIADAVLFERVGSVSSSSSSLAWTGCANGYSCTVGWHDNQCLDEMGGLPNPELYRRECVGSCGNASCSGSCCRFVPVSSSSKSSSSAGSVSSCGNGRVDASEACDDGNRNSNDGCSGSCTVETGWRCQLVCPQTLGGFFHSFLSALFPSLAQSTTSCSSYCSSVCGDGIVVGSEICDMGSQNGTGGLCSNDCVPCPALSPPLCPSGYHLVPADSLGEDGCMRPPVCVKDGSSSSAAGGAAWVQVGPPHTMWNTCQAECASRGFSCVESGCAEFSAWNGTFSGGEKLYSGGNYHYECSNQWGTLSSTKVNHCCCSGAGSSVSSARSSSRSSSSSSLRSSSSFSSRSSSSSSRPASSSSSSRSSSSSSRPASSSSSAHSSSKFSSSSSSEASSSAAVVDLAIAGVVVARKDTSSPKTIDFTVTAINIGGKAVPANAVAFDVSCQPLESSTSYTGAGTIKGALPARGGTAAGSLTEKWPLEVEGTLATPVVFNHFCRFSVRLNNGEQDADARNNYVYATLRSEPGWGMLLFDLVVDEGASPTPENIVRGTDIERWFVARNTTGNWTTERTIKNVKVRIVPGTDALVLSSLGSDCVKADDGSLTCSVAKVSAQDVEYMHYGIRVADGTSCSSAMHVFETAVASDRDTGALTRDRRFVVDCPSSAQSSSSKKSSSSKPSSSSQASSSAHSSSSSSKQSSSVHSSSSSSVQHSSSSSSASPSSPAWVEITAAGSTWNSCEVECGGLGLTCLEDGCASFTAWDGASYSGGEHVSGPFSAHYQCSNEWVRPPAGAMHACCCGQ